ncbi:MAG TPA: hypothetical protein VJK48_01475 [Chlamydiales bacterium]|nr:hypothetical protein [Chlamydiales bacterium]
MKHLALFFLIPSLLFSQYDQHVSPEEIQAELTEAQAQFDNALNLFDPWYTGPLLTPSASLMPLGSAMMQPYLFFTDYYGFYNEDREAVSAPDKFQLLSNPVFIQFGVSPTVDATIGTTVVGNWQEGSSGGGFGDLSTSLGFSIMLEGLYYPKAKFTISETFPTGKYNNLSSNGLGLNGTGAGTYATTFTIALGKLFLWNTTHPLNTRTALTYTVNTPVQVSNFNAYGGGFGTKGIVQPGGIFQSDIGIEWTVNQPWVLALDIVYTFQNRTTFHGNPGVTADGTPASVGGGYSDKLSLAPAIEYNFSGKMGLIGGAWFSVYGRNSSNFVSGIFSWFWMFP